MSAASGQYDRYGSDSTFGSDAGFIPSADGGGQYVTDPSVPRGFVSINGRLIATGSNQPGMRFSNVIDNSQGGGGGGGGLPIGTESTPTGALGPSTPGNIAATSTAANATPEGIAATPSAAPTLSK